MSDNPINVEARLQSLNEALDRADAQEVPALATTLGRLHLQLAGQADKMTADNHLRSAAKAFETGLVAIGRLMVAADVRDDTLLAQYGELSGLLVATELRLANLAQAEGDMLAANAHRSSAYLAAERDKVQRAAFSISYKSGQSDAAADLLPRIERLRRELAWLDRQIEGEGHSGDVRINLARQAEDIWAELRRLLEGLVRADPNFAVVRGVAEPLRPEDVAAAVPVGGALVLLYPLEDSLACFVLRHYNNTHQPNEPGVAATVVSIEYAPTDGAPLHGRAALAVLVKQALASSSGIVGTRSLEPALVMLGRALHPALSPLLPVPDPDNPPSLVLVPTGPLHRLPLHALPWPTVDKRLLDDYAVSYATSTDTFVLATHKPAASSGAVALAPGLPANLSIPGTIATACALVHAAGGVVLLHKQANLKALLQDRVAAQVRWVYFGTCGRAGGADPSRSGLLFYDEQGAEPVWLTVSEIRARLDLSGVEHLDASTDSTHADDPVFGDGSSGLVSALLYRGARSVQATLWPVRDDAAALVSAWTWEALLAGETNKAAALRAAVQRLRRCSGGEAAAELRRLATELATVLPPDDRAHAQLAATATYLEMQMRPFLRSPDWAPFVLHGAPLTAPSA